MMGSVTKTLVSSAVQSTPGSKFAYANTNYVFKPSCP